MRAMARTHPRSLLKGMCYTVCLDQSFNVNGLGTGFILEKKFLVLLGTFGNESSAPIQLHEEALKFVLPAPQTLHPKP